MRPNISFGVLAQTRWPANGGPPYDDCWVCAALNALHGIAGWEHLPNTTAFRAAAGNPDDPTKPDGGTIAQTAQAIRALWPKIGKQITVLDGAVGAWPTVSTGLAAGATVDLFVLSDALPAEHRYGFTSTATKLALHAVAAATTDQLRLCNPLAAPHSRWKPITEAQLQAAAVAWPGPGIHAIVFPTADAAFLTHPSYPAPGLTPAELEALILAARRSQYDADLAAAQAAPIDIGPRP